MWRPLTILLVIMTCSSCGRGDNPPDAYARWQDRIVVRTGLPLFGPTRPCLRKEHDPKLGDYYAFVGTDQCYRTLPQQRWRGLWHDAFEDSRFCAAPAKECDYQTPGDRIWLNGEKVRTKPPGAILFAVDFIGRRTAVKGHYGHMGMSDYEVIVDKVISMQPLEFDPEPTETQIEIEERRRAGAKR